MIRFATCLLTLTALPLFADPPQPVVVNAVTDRYRSVSFDQEKLAGLLARRMRANSEGYLEHVDDAAFLRNTKGPGGVTELGSFPPGGRILEAAAYAYEYRHDEHLKATMDRAAKQLIAAQANHHDYPSQVTDESSDGQRLLAAKYDLLGLLAYYRLTGEANSLTAARRIGDLLVKTFNNSANRLPYRRDIALIEPLVSLYKYTEDPRYLDFCRSAADAWLQSKQTHAAPSAENLSDLHGLVELYRVTGDESYFRPVPAAWMQVRNNALSLTGTPLSNGEPSHGVESKNGGDACATLAWIQLTLNLLRVTGEPQYAEQLEHTVYNHLFAGQDANTGAILVTAPLHGGSKQPASKSDACAASEAEGVALIPAAVWGRYDSGIAVLLYNAGRASFQLRRRGTVQLYSEAAFPESGDVLLHVEPGHNLRFPLRLRVPEWTSKFTVAFGGSRLEGKPGEFLTLNREWKPGDTVKISIDMSVHVLPGAADYPDQIAVQRGPQILALASILNPLLKDLTHAAIVAGDTSRPKLTPLATALPSNWPGDQAYTMAGEYEGKSQQLVLAPFADARTYRVWLKRPSASTGATD